MRERVVHQLNDMLVGQAVVEVLSIAAPLDQLSVQQCLQPGGNRRELGIVVHQLADTPLAILQAVE